MACINCDRPEKKWCEEWGLPSKEAVLCWATSQPLPTNETKPIGDKIQ
jgi:hypothetical protein